VLKLRVYISVLLVSVVAIIFVRSELVTALLVGVIATVMIPILDEVVGQRGLLTYFWYGLRYRSSKIRLSMSYLYRINVDGRYLLVRGSRFSDQFQPVGGVFKLLPEGHAALHELGTVDDDLLPIDETSRNDLRVRLPASSVYEFMKWYESGSGREVDPWREFYEELVAPGLLKAETFPWIMTRKIRRVHNPIRYSDYAQSLEVLVADVYELIPTAAQSEALRALLSSESSDICWATEHDIDRRGFRPESATLTRISETASWVI
jgi:hypothetical protein